MNCDSDQSSSKPLDFNQKHLDEDEIYKKLIMEPVTLDEIDQENSSFFDSDNFKELSDNECFEIDDVDKESKNNQHGTMDDS